MGRRGGVVVPAAPCLLATRRCLLPYRPTAAPALPGRIDRSVVAGLGARPACWLWPILTTPTPWPHWPPRPTWLWPAPVHPPALVVPRWVSQPHPPPTLYRAAAALLATARGRADGSTVHYMDEGLDTGGIAAQTPCPCPITAARRRAGAGRGRLGLLRAGHDQLAAGVVQRAAGAGRQQPRARRDRPPRTGRPAGVQLHAWHGRLGPAIPGGGQRANGVVGCGRGVA
jgi:hypothetical protein